MNKISFMIFVLFILSFPLFSATVDCSKVFEQRKAELMAILDRIDEEKLALESLKNAGKNVQLQKEKKIATREAEITKKLAESVKKEQNAKEILAKNEKILEDIKKVNQDKINETILKMKPGNAAALLSEMDVNASSEILYYLPSKKVGEIFSKTEPTKAAKMTERLKKGPPFGEK